MNVRLMKCKRKAQSMVKLNDPAVLKELWDGIGFER